MVIPTKSLLLPICCLLIQFSLAEENSNSYYNSNDVSQSVFQTHITAYLRVTAITTYLTSPTSFVTNHKTYNISDVPTTLTITQCPCDLRTDVTIPATPLTRTTTYKTYQTLPSETTTLVNNGTETWTLEPSHSYTLTDFIQTRTDAVFIIPTGHLPGQFVTVTIDPPSQPTGSLDAGIKAQVIYILDEYNDDGSVRVQDEDQVIVTSIAGIGHIAIVTTGSVTSTAMDYSSWVRHDVPTFSYPTETGTTAPSLEKRGTVELLREDFDKNDKQKPTSAATTTILEQSKRGNYDEDGVVFLLREDFYQNGAEHRGMIDTSGSLAVSVFSILVFLMLFA